jgi:hypothetical protein
MQNADLDRVPTTNVLNEKKIAEIVGGFGNVAEVLNSADPSELAALYAALRLEMVYNAAAKIVGVSIRPTGRGSNRVRTGVRGGLEPRQSYLVRRSNVALAAKTRHGS